MKRRLLGNTALLGLTQAVNYIAPFLVLLHLTKTLGLDLYGVLSFSQGIANLCLVLIDLGYSLSATNKISRKRLDKKYIGKLIGGIFVIKTLLFLVCAIFIVCFTLHTKQYSNYKVIFWVSLFSIAMQGFIPSWFFYGVEKIKVISIAAIISKILFSIMILNIVESQADYSWVPLLYGIEQLMVLAISIFYIYKLGYKIKKPSIRMIIYCFKFTRHFFASRVAVSTYMNSGVVILGLAAQPAVVAIYAMAEQLYKAMQSALAPAAVAAYPYMAKEKDVSFMIMLIKAVVGVAAIGAFFGYLAAPSVLSIMFGYKWLAAIPVLNIFLVAIIIHAAAIMTGYPLAAIVGRLDIANTSVILGAVVYLGLLLIMFTLKILSPMSLAIIMVVSELCVVLYRCFMLYPLVIRINSQKEAIS